MRRTTLGQCVPVTLREGKMPRQKSALGVRCSTPQEPPEAKKMRIEMRIIKEKLGQTEGKKECYELSKCRRGKVLKIVRILCAV